MGWSVYCEIFQGRLLKVSDKFLQSKPLQPKSRNLEERCIVVMRGGEEMREQARRAAELVRSGRPNED